MQRTVIIPDTNVIVSASIMQNLQDSGSIKHVFYDQAIQMFSLFVTRADVKGVAVPAVTNECFKVVIKAVKSTLVASKKRHRSRAANMYKMTSGIVASSEIKMRGLLSRLDDACMDDAALSNNRQRVRRMSEELKHTYENTYAKYAWREVEAKERTKSISSEPAWLEEQKKEVFKAHRAQIITEARQLKRFVAKYPNKADQEILAQAVTYKDCLPSKPRIWIASLDTGFFSPHRHRGTTDKVTKRILQEFKIKCDLPSRVFEMVSGD